MQNESVHESSSTREVLNDDDVFAGAIGAIGAVRCACANCQATHGAHSDGTDHIKHCLHPPCNDCKPLIEGCRQFLLFVHKFGVKRFFFLFLQLFAFFLLLPLCSLFSHQRLLWHRCLWCLDSLFFNINLGGTRLNVQSPHWNTAPVFMGNFS